MLMHRRLCTTPGQHKETLSGRCNQISGLSRHKRLRQFSQNLTYLGTWQRVNRGHSLNDLISFARSSRRPCSAPLAGPTWWQRRRSRKLSTRHARHRHRVELVLTDSGPYVTKYNHRHSTPGPCTQPPNHSHGIPLSNTFLDEMGVKCF